MSYNFHGYSFTKKPTGREWVRLQVRMRDNFTCADCKKFRTPEMATVLGKRLFDTHHLSGLCGKLSRAYDKIADIDGLITLCHKCHYNRPEHRMKRKSLAKKTLEDLWLPEFLADSRLPHEMNLV
mgnify:CR=1 FL=1